MCIAILWLFGSFVNNLEAYVNQTKKFEDIRAKLKSLIIYKDKQETLIREFKIYLADKYPDLEKEIFTLIANSNNDVSVILSYPEIKSSEVWNFNN